MRTSGDKRAKVDNLAVQVYRQLSSGKIEKYKQKKFHSDRQQLSLRWKPASLLQHSIEQFQNIDKI